MSSNAKIGLGSVFSIGGALVGDSYTACAGVTNISGPGLSRDTVDATDFDSTGGYREYITGLRDGGEVTLELEFVPAAATTTALLTDFADDTPKFKKITFPDTTAWTFKALLTNYEPGVPFDDKMTASVTYKLSGKPTFAV